MTRTTHLLPDLPHDPAAVDVNRLSRHVAAGVAGEEGHGFGDVLRFSGMAEGDSLSCGFPLNVGVSRPDSLGGDAAGSHHIGAHAEGGELER